MDTLYIVLAGINLVIMEAACQPKKRFKSNVVCTKLYGGEIFQSFDISAKHLPLRSAF